MERSEGDQVVHQPQVVEGRPLQRPQPRGRQAVAARMEYYEGLLPHPDHAERFEQLAPGSTGKLVTMAERQGGHRQAMERKFLNFNGWSQIAGVIFAGLIGLASIGGTVYLAMNDKPAGVIGLTLTPLAGIVWAYRGARGNQQKEIAKKTR